MIKTSAQDEVNSCWKQNRLYQTYKTIFLRWPPQGNRYTGCTSSPTQQTGLFAQTPWELEWTLRDDNGRLFQLGQSPTLFGPDTWVDPWDTWTPPAGVGLPSNLQWAIHLFSGKEVWNQIPDPRSYLTLWSALVRLASLSTMRPKESSPSSRGGILRAPNYTPPSTQLHLET